MIGWTASFSLISGDIVSSLCFARGLVDPSSSSLRRSSRISPFQSGLRFLFLRLFGDRSSALFAKLSFVFGVLLFGFCRIRWLSLWSSGLLSTMKHALDVLWLPLIVCIPSGSGISIH